MLGIMRDIEHGSLVMIDETEHSAHPNWQINYVGWLKKIFKDYYDCHFVIATHSHFILTDLKPESSDIIALEKTDDGIVHDIAEGLNTFCWSVDDILYRVFHVRNTRNRVFEEKVADLYDRISRRDKDKEGIYSLIWELTQYQLSEEDPLSRLIQTAKEYVESE
jgi:predicted ATP-binding protein involved in virulence